MPDFGGRGTVRVGLLQRHFPDFEIAPDLGSRIGTLTWYRGAATCMGLCALARLLSPGVENTIYGYVPTHAMRVIARLVGGFAAS